MRIRRFLLLCALSAAAPGALAQERTRLGAVNAPNLRLRAAPDLDAEVLSLLPEGERVEVLDQSPEKARVGEVEAYWYRLRTAVGTTGWSFGQYVDVTSSYAYEGVELLLDETLARGISGRIVAPSEWGPTPQHIALTLEGYAPSAHLPGRVGVSTDIRVYPLSGSAEAALLGRDPRMSRLSTIIGEGKLPGEGGGIPEYPPVFAAQVRVGHAALLGFRNGKGLRFLCAHLQNVPKGAALDPLEYVFQGLTHDARAFVHVRLAISHPALASLDFSDHAERARIGALAPADFLPAMPLLDALVESLLVEPMVPSPYPGWVPYRSAVQGFGFLYLVYPAGWSAQGGEGSVRLACPGAIFTIRYGADIPEEERRAYRPGLPGGSVEARGTLPVLGFPASREAELVGGWVMAVCYQVPEIPRLGRGGALLARLEARGGAALEQGVIDEAERVLGSAGVAVPESP